MPTQVLVLILVLGHQVLVLVLGHQVLVLVLVLESQVLDNNTANDTSLNSATEKLIVFCVL